MCSIEPLAYKGLKWSLELHAKIQVNSFSALSVYHKYCVRIMAETFLQTVLNYSFFELCADKNSEFQTASLTKYNLNSSWRLDLKKKLKLNHMISLHCWQVKKKLINDESQKQKCDGKNSHCNICRKITFIKDNSISLSLFLFIYCNVKNLSYEITS